MADGDVSADKVCLRDAKPVVRNKYLYLYDFGDNNPKQREFVSISRLVEKELHLVGYEEINLLYRLEAAGLVDIDESKEHLYLKVRCGEKKWNEYGITANLQKWCELSVLFAIR